MHNVCISVLSGCSGVFFILLLLNENSLYFFLSVVRNGKVPQLTWILSKYPPHCHKA